MLTASVWSRLCPAQEHRFSKCMIENKPGTQRRASWKGVSSLGDHNEDMCTSQPSERSPGGRRKEQFKDEKGPVSQTYEAGPGLGERDLRSLQGQAGTKREVGWGKARVWRAGSGPRRGFGQDCLVCCGIPQTSMAFSKYLELPIAGGSLPRVWAPASCGLSLPPQDHFTWEKKPGVRG